MRKTAQERLRLVSWHSLAYFFCVIFSNCHLVSKNKLNFNSRQALLCTSFSCSFLRLSFSNYFSVIWIFGPFLRMFFRHVFVSYFLVMIICSHSYIVIVLLPNTLYGVFSVCLSAVYARTQETKERTWTKNNTKTTTSVCRYRLLRRWLIYCFYGFDCVFPCITFAYRRRVFSNKTVPIRFSSFYFCRCRCAILTLYMCVQCTYTSHTCRNLYTCHLCLALGKWNEMNRCLQ